MKRDEPSVLKLFNLTEEEEGDPGKALLSAGVRKMFDWDAGASSRAEVRVARRTTDGRGAGWRF